MMTNCKITSFCLVGLLVFGLATSALSQSKSPNRGEIFDINPASLQVSQIKIRLEKYRTITDSLFRYPDESVSYIFNGMPLGSISDAMRLLFTNLDYIETISTSEYDKGGKRLIAVKFRPH